MFAIVMFLIYLFFVLQSTAYFTILERHVLGLTQNRFGPKKVSWFGLLQPIIDGLKLCKKEQILQFNCSPGLFLGITIMSFAVYYMEFLCLPYPYSFISMYWSYLLLIIIVSVNVYFLIVGGIYSKSKYSYLGSIRSAVASVSYEVVFSLNVLIFAHYHKSFECITLWNVGVWLYFLAFFISTLVELSRTPFDYVESESELVGGVTTEYSSVGFVLLFLKEYGSLLFFSVLTSTIFMNGLFLVTVIVFFSLIVVRSSFPRLRYDKLMGLMWLEMFFHISLGLYSTYYLLLM